MTNKEKMYIDSHKNKFKNSKGNFKERIKLKNLISHARMGNIQVVWIL